MTIKSQNSDSEAAYLHGIGKAQLMDAFKKEAREVSHEAEGALSSVLSHENDLSRQDKIETQGALTDIRDEGNKTGTPQSSSGLKGQVANEPGAVGKEPEVGGADPAWGSGSYAPISMASGIIVAFLALIAFSNILNQLQTDLSIQWAHAQMGAQTQNGQVVSYDYKDSIANHWFQGQVDAGKKQADGLRDQAIGAIVGAVVGGLAIAALGIGYFKTDTSAPAKQIEDAKAYRDSLSTVDGNNVDIEMVNVGRPDSAAVRARMAEMRDGVNLDRGFRTDAAGNRLDRPVDGTGGLTEREINETAVRHIRAGDEASRQKALENAEKHLQKLQNQAQAGQTKFQTLAQAVNVSNAAGDSSGKAYGNWGNADATNAAAKLKASSEVAQQSYQQVQNSLDKAIQSAIQNHEAANSTAASMGQALAAANR